MDKEILEKLSKDAFDIIELIEVAGVEGTSFNIIRKRLLDLGNDILRLDKWQK
jgi:hypothetical protein